METPPIYNRQTIYFYGSSIPCFTMLYPRKTRCPAWTGSWASIYPWPSDCGRSWLCRVKTLKQITRENTTHCLISNYFLGVQKNDFLEIVASTPMVSGWEAWGIRACVFYQPLDRRWSPWTSLNPKRGKKKCASWVLLASHTVINVHLSL